MLAQTTVATRPLRIAVDYTSAVNQNAGIGRFVRSLVHAVVQHDPTDAFLLLHANPNPGRSPNYPGSSNVSRRVLRVNERWMNIIWHRLQVPIPADWLTGPVDLFHSPDFVLPPIRGARSILTVHDLAFLLYPIVLSCVCLGIVTMMMVYVVPKVIEVFESSKGKLPLATEILVDLYTFFSPPAPYHQLFVLTPSGAVPTPEAGHHLARERDRWAHRAPVALQKE